MHLTTISILLVEDNPDDADLLQELLSEVLTPHFSLTHVIRLSQAVEQLKKEQFDIVLLDLSLPDSEGLGGLSKINEVTGEVPIIVLTAFDKEEVVYTALQMGAQDYLVKGQHNSLMIVQSIRYAIERKRIEVRLRRSNEKLKQFAYVVSHDLQEPLRMIKSYLELLERRYKGQLDDKADKYIHYAVDGAARMQSLITDLLNLSRLESRNPPFEEVESSLILEQVLANLKLAIEESGGTITYDDPLPTLIVQPTRLEQIFQNLIGNALKFRGEEPPEIHIWAVEDREYWKFAIRDKGIGIDPEQSPHIFDLFKRGQGHKYEGSGIGLAICKKIVEQHKGKIWVESQPGQGTTFYFTLLKRPPLN